MKKTSAILALALSVGFIGSWIYNEYESHVEMRDSIAGLESLQTGSSGDLASWQFAEKFHGLIGSAFLIVGLSLWPKEKVST